MAYEFDGKIHVYACDGGYDEYLTKGEVEKRLNKKQLDFLMENGWIIVEGFCYEL